MTHVLKENVNLGEFIQLAEVLHGLECIQLTKGILVKDWEGEDDDPGWAVFETSSSYANELNLEIRKCDDSQRFNDDEDAARYVIQTMRELGYFKTFGRCKSEECELCIIEAMYPDYETEEK